MPASSPASPVPPDRSSAAVRPVTVLAPELAVTLVVWAMARRHEGAIGTPTQLCKRLEHLMRRGIPVVDLDIEAVAGGARRSEVLSDCLQRMQATGIVQRLSLPLRLTPWGQPRLEYYLATSLAAPATRAIVTQALEALELTPADVPPPDPAAAPRRRPAGARRR